ncbi:hypothetical protein [Cupriavidus sp. D39]|uniref:hypothetical protein n=1 Tax=Cupriavidus sp. D39 TaxID=2997877 RepID=UPI0022707A01|nr:hypothetical protein [Cupriavidus sp. D39]MCY0853315.1 hypothetical protein [Cupriavidus sp. D39]
MIPASLPALTNARPVLPELSAAIQSETTYSGSVETTGEANRQASAHSGPQPGTPAPDPEIERYRQMLGASWKATPSS